MLRRFPGTKWIVHNGWYSYNGRDYNGWYFTSIPAQTTIPMNEYDLQGIVIVSGKDVSPSPDVVPVPTSPGPFPPTPPEPFPPVPPKPYPGPMPPHPHGPGPYPYPYPDDKYGPNPFPPMPPGPDPDVPAFFGKKNLNMLNSAFITVERRKDFEALDTSVMPDGRYVCVNSLDGKRTFFRWNARDDRWDEVDPVAIINDEIDYALQSYSTSEEVNTKIQESKDAVLEALDTAKSDLQANIDVVQENLSSAVSSLNEDISKNATDIEELGQKIDTVEQAAQTAIEELSAKESEDVDGLTNSIEILQSAIDEIREQVQSDESSTSAQFNEVDSRLDLIEDAIFNIKKLAEVLGSNTILVSNEGSISDSGIAIGDDVIGEIADYANDKTVATEKAVAELVERSQTKWTSF